MPRDARAYAWDALNAAELLRDSRLRSRSTTTSLIHVFGFQPWKLCCGRWWTDPQPGRYQLPPPPPPAPPPTDPPPNPPPKPPPPLDDGAVAADVVDASSTGAMKA
jgi:hypothetical protein